MNPLPLASWLAGFVAAEGCFVTARFHGRKAFGLVVSLGATDAGCCEVLRDFFGCGTLHRFERRKVHYDDEVRFQVRKLADLVEIVVPFMDEHLLPSYKRDQYEAWRAELLEYWEHDARRRRPCTVEDCDLPQRAKDLCRHHYDEVYNR